MSPSERKWFLMLAVVNVYPKLESEELIDNLLEPALRFLAPGHDGVQTVGDLRDDHLLWTPYIGIGRILSDRWAAFFQVGYSGGTLRTVDNDRSLAIVPLHSDFELFRSAAYIGVGVDYFPFGMPPQQKYDGFKERFKASRPSFGLRYSWTYATYEMKFKVGFDPLPNFLGIKLEDSWFLPSVNVNVGYDFPLNETSQLSFNAGYAHFWDQEADFEGPVYTIGWKHFFR